MHAAEPRRFDVPAPGKAAWVTLIGLGVAIPFAIVAVVMAIDPQEARELLDAMPWIVPLHLLAFAVPAIAMRRRSVSFDGRELQIRSTFYTRRTAVESLALDDARVLDLTEKRELHPLAKTNGYALPGFYAGYFRGALKEPVFCLVTQPRRVLALPERDGRLLLLSVERPRALLDALRAATDRPRVRPPATGDRRAGAAAKLPR